MGLDALFGAGRVKTPRNSIDVSEAAGVRYLHFGSEWVQGAMRVARPFALELEYTREMMLPLLLAPDEGWPPRVLAIGLGAGSVVKFLHRYCPQSSITVVEIDPRMRPVSSRMASPYRRTKRALPRRRPTPSISRPRPTV